jgi:hypothetical protein
VLPLFIGGWVLIILIYLVTACHGIITVFPQTRGKSLGTRLTQRTLATLLYAFFENIDFNVILCTNVTKDVLKQHKIVIKLYIFGEIISYKMCAVKVRNAKLRNYLKLLFPEVQGCEPVTTAGNLN